MAAGDSPVGIANLALVSLGEDPIASLFPPDNSKAAILAAQFYHPSRRAMLEAACWRCAKRQAKLAASTEAPLFEYGYAYPLPADFVRLFKLQWHAREPYEVMNLDGIGPCIAAHHGAPIDLDYIFDLQDCTQMAPTLVMAIAYDLAAALAVPLTHDIGLKNTAEQEREGRLAIARTTSAQQASTREWDVDVLLRSRF